MSKAKQQSIKLKYKILMVILTLYNIALLNIIGVIAYYYYYYLSPGFY